MTCGYKQMPHGGSRPPVVPNFHNRRLSPLKLPVATKPSSRRKPSGWTSRRFRKMFALIYVYLYAIYI